MTRIQQTLVADGRLSVSVSPSAVLGRVTLLGLRGFLLGCTGLFYIAAGAFHFWKPAYYLQIMPPYVPWPLGMVYLSGAAEMAGGAGLLIPQVRRWAAWGLAVLLITVFPANLYMAMEHIQVAGTHLPQVLLWIRLPFQVALVAWVLWVAK